MGRLWLGGQSLRLSLGLKGSTLLGGSVQTSDVVVTAVRRLDVLDSDVDSLHQDTVADGLGDLDTDGLGANVPHTTGSAVVKLVRHTLLDGSVGLDVNIVTELVGGQVGGQMVGAGLSEGTGELAAGAGAVTE